MTQEQLSDLFLQLEHLRPAEEKETFTDPEFAAEQAKLEEENRGVLWEDTLIVSPGEAPAPVSVSHADEWEEIDEDWWQKHYRPS